MCVEREKEREREILQSEMSKETVLRGEPYRRMDAKLHNEEPIRMHKKVPPPTCTQTDTDANSKVLVLDENHIGIIARTKDPRNSNELPSGLVTRA